MKVIATGGLANTSASETNCVNVVDEWLTLRGLRIIWHLNN